MSKGSRPRPFSISQEEYGNRMDAIFGKKDKRVTEDAQAEDEAFDLVDKANKDNYNTSTETDK
jgi:hypothetical protein